MEVNLTVKDHVRTFVLETYLPDADPAGLTYETELVTTGIIDSIRVLSLVEFMEEEFDIMLEPHELHRLTTVANIAEVIDEKRD